ncbi:MAG: hypothetical protein DCC67_15335 [Planctomycetota bacterium]|nr:MAG: hypothetical protein DCC67_15335 [Planctomycetota bacterium]
MARRRSNSTDLADDDADALQSRPRRRRPRRRLRLLVALLALPVLVIAAPTIVAKTALRNVVLSGALPPGAGRIACRDASFSWAAGQALAGVTVLDPSGAPLFGADTVESSRSLIGLFADPDDLGTIKITRPVMQLDTREGGSNLEDLLQKIATAAVQQAPARADGSPRAMTVEVVITQGTVYGRDLASGQQWRIDALDAVAKRTPNAAAWDVTASGVLSLAAGQRPAGGPPSDAVLLAATPGRFKFHLHPDSAGGGDAPARSGGDAPARSGGDAPARPGGDVQMRGDGDSPTGQRLELIADRLPLAPIEPWLARVLPAARLTGEASADLQISWRPPREPARLAPSGPGRPAPGVPPPGASLPAHLTAAGKLNAANLRFTSAALAGDLLELPTAAIALDAALIEGRLSAKQLSARSPWLQADVAGDFHLAELRTLALRSLPTSDASVTVRAELPQLARMLPRTLRLRPGVRVDAGSMEVTARSSSADGARRWTVAAAVQDLVGSDGAHPIQWTQPVEIAVDVADSPAGPRFQRGLLRSVFASASVDGMPEGGLEGHLQFNLDELAGQLGQFVDLSAWKLAGGGDGRFSLRAAGADRFAADAKLDLKQIDVQRNGQVVWRDPQLRVELQAAGGRVDFKPQRFDSATLLVRAPDDSLAAELLEPVDLGDFHRGWLVKVAGNGSLERWAGRLRPWIAAVPDQVAGQSTFSAQLRAREGLLEVAQMKVSVETLLARLGERTISEPRIEAAGDFRWDKLARAIESQNLEMTSSTVAGRARGVAIQLVENGPPTVRGEVALRGDLERLAAWQDALSGRTQARGVLPRGQAVGRLHLSSDPHRAALVLSIKSEPFQLVNVSDGSLAWNEPTLELAAEAAYTHGDDRLQLASVKLTGKTVQLAGAGLVEQLRTTGVVRGDVNITYDAAELATLLAAYLGPGVQIQGANAARLQASGPLFAALPYEASRGVPAPGAPVPVPGASAPPSSLWGARTRGGDSATPPTWNASTASTSAPPPASSLPPPASGPPLHWSRRWQLTADTAWSAANLYGLPVGAARLTANVRDGEIQFAPLDLTVGPGGRINLHPRVLLDPLPPHSPQQRLQLAPGPVISNVAISADVSERMLKYAAPILAGATRSEGSFSFFLNSADIPLRQPQQGRLDGRLTIHQLAVTPGPLLQDVANLVRQIEALGKNSSPGLGAGLGQGLLGLNLLGGAPQQPQPLKGVTMSERTIDVQVADGRVYHRNLEFLIDDVPVRSSGSVGFDETLAITIEVAIQEKWVGHRPALKALVGQPLSIPVGGTFSRPQVDPRAIGAFVAQAAQQAAGGVIGEELNKALDKLLPR